MKNQPISTSILCVIYALFIAGGMYSAFTRGLSVVSIVFLAMMIVTLLAMLGLGGKWAWIVGIIYSTLMLIVGLGAIILGGWEYVIAKQGTPAAIIFGIGFALFGIATNRVLVRVESTSESETS